MKRITRWHRLAASDERTNEATKLDARTKKKKDLQACKWRRGRETSRREREKGGKDGKNKEESKLVEYARGPIWKINRS